MKCLNRQTENVDALGNVYGRNEPYLLEGGRKLTRRCSSAKRRMVPLFSLAVEEQLGSISAICMMVELSVSRRRRSTWLWFSRRRRIISSAVRLSRLFLLRMLRPLILYADCRVLLVLVLVKVAAIVRVPEIEGPIEVEVFDLGVESLGVFISERWRLIA